MHMTLPCFAQSLGGCSFTSFSRWGMLPHFVESLGDAPRFASSLGDAPRFASSLGGAPRFASSLSIKLFHRIANLVVSMHMTMVWELR